MNFMFHSTLICPSMITYALLLFLLKLSDSAAEKVVLGNVTNSFTDVGIVPDLIKQAPKELLRVRFSKNVTVQLGNVLTPTQVQKQPVLRWRAMPDTFYTLIMTDPDPTPDMREWHHWIVGNIPGNFVAQGEIITAYVGSAPPKGSGMHRYVFLLYKHTNKTVFDEKRLSDTDAKDRSKFSTELFTKKYMLGNPVAGNFYIAEYDDLVPTLHAKFTN